jgi:predicted HicB family RNase H-like nuclease
MAIQDIFPGSSEVAPRPFRPDELIDEMLACYAEWRQEVWAVDETYRHWCAAPSAERDRCFAVYFATLDQEESAAATYAIAAEQVRVLLNEIVETSLAERPC